MLRVVAMISLFELLRAALIHKVITNARSIQKEIIPSVAQGGDYSVFPACANFHFFNGIWQAQFRWQSDSLCSVVRKDG